MREFFRLKYELQEIELTLMQHRERENQTHEEIKRWGMSYFTKEIRERIIQSVKENESDERVSFLTTCSTKWEEGQITYSDVLTFAAYDRDIQREENIDYSGKLTHRLYGILFGGE